MNDAFVPIAPHTLEDAGLTGAMVESLVIKALADVNGATGSALARRLGLPAQPVRDILQDLRQRKLVVHRDVAAIAGDFHHDLSVAGFELARELRRRTSWSSRAPVPYSRWLESLEAQSPRHIPVTKAALWRAMDVLELPDTTLRRIGMALCSGHALFLYGPPGNGKTTIAERLSQAFGGTVFIPYAVEIDGQILRMFDPRVHEPVEETDGEVRIDPRWVRCKRPTVIAGGELTLDALEIHTDPHTGLLEAPLQLKACGGVLLIDDLGRQRMSPAALLNRWIVPLERHVDFLRVPGGATLEVPFETFVVFSTNLDPLSLTDEAFLRRIPYKIEITDPSRDDFVEIMQLQARDFGLDLPQASIDHLLRTQYQHRPMRGCHPRDLLRQVRDRQAFLGGDPVVSPAALDEAAASYFVGPA